MQVAALSILLKINIQFLLSGEIFQAYDYGENGNLAAYGSNKPLVYNLRKVTVPVFNMLSFSQRKFSDISVCERCRYTYFQAGMITL